MSRKHKPLRQCGDWSEVGRSFEHSNAVEEPGTNHRKWRGPTGIVVHPRTGPAKIGTLLSVIRMAAAAGIVFGVLAVLL